MFIQVFDFYYNSTLLSQLMFKTKFKNAEKWRRLCDLYIKMYKHVKDLVFLLIFNIVLNVTKYE